MSNKDIKNFKYLDNLIHSGAMEIVLDSDIVLAVEEESQYLNGINLDVDDLAIDGNGHTIDALGLTRIFYCAGKNVIIKNIILKNGFTEDGGAIYNCGDSLSLESCNFKGNASKNNGGAVFNEKSSLSLESCSFVGNSSKMYAGAIWNNEGFSRLSNKRRGYNLPDISLSLESCSFENNSSKSIGGAIFLYNATKYEFENCTFKDNKPDDVYKTDEE